MKKLALALSLLATPALQGCPETKADKPEIVDSTRSKASKTVCKNGKLCTPLENGKEFCITPITPCKEKKK